MFIDRKAFGFHRLCQLWQLAMTSAECTISIPSSFLMRNSLLWLFLSIFLTHSPLTFYLKSIFTLHKKLECHRICSDSSAIHFRFFHLLIALLNFMFFSESFRRLFLLQPSYKISELF